MIITKQKPLDEILEFLENHKRIFIVGCGSCATLCKTGGEEEVLQMKKILEKKGFEVTGDVIPDETCHIPLTERKLREKKKELKKSDAILVLACGSGVQSISLTAKQPVYPGIDSLFIGNVVRFGSFVERCSACGNCYLGETTGICPITCCPKTILNGPCGGVEEGKCEVDPNMDCIWIQIYERLKEKGELDKMKKIKSPRKYHLKKNPNSLTIDE
ncbi:MAG TPA: methylenetetrahydrofolate reductase C-terminal domain-containing protein [Nitrospinota bacterium]|nr:methylenetetrahydrofolate reductase C-terminal domain-containing protein [Nitrospinota bacterium]